MGIATETIKALKGELPATLADYLYDAIGKLEVIKIKHKLVKPNVNSKLKWEIPT